MLKAILKEYGLPWAVNRVLYSAKLKSMALLPQTECLYEKKVNVKQIDIFSIDIGCLKQFLNALTDNEKIRIINDADRTIDGRIEGFSSIELNYGSPFNWQLNPLTGKATDLNEKWYKIPDFDKERGDIKVIWEASRFTHLLTLARAYCISEDSRYYKAFSDQINEWVIRNRYSYGANYKCGQECSIRMINVLLAYIVFQNAEVTSTDDERNVKTIVKDSYRKILSNFFYAYKCIKNNHTISEIMGMVVGAWCCEDQKQLNKAYGYLEKIINNQFTEDGGYAQYSFNYQRLALMELNIILSISNKTGLQIGESAKKRLLNSTLLLYQCQAPNYDLPNYGSNDGSLIFKMTSCGYRDFRPVCNTTYRLITGKELYAEDLHREELIWHGLHAGIGTFDNIDKCNMAYSEAGIFTIRNDNSMMMLVCNDYHKRPGHMDQLHLEFWIKDVNVFCDCGTYSYASELGQRLIRCESHNTAEVTNKEQMLIKPPFLIYDWSERKELFFSDDIIRAKVLFKTGYSHEREIVKTVYGFEIKDKVSSDGKQLTKINFHTVCDVEIDGNQIKLSNQGKNVCSMITNGTFDLKQADKSLYYFKAEKINCISIIKSDNKVVLTKILMEDN